MCSKEVSKIDFWNKPQINKMETLGKHEEKEKSRLNPEAYMLLRNQACLYAPYGSNSTWKVSLRL